MNPICPICNGLESIHLACKRCGQVFEDCGRYTDFFDDYSAYLEIDDMKKKDGISNDYYSKKCSHLLYCEYCNEQSIILVSEI